MRAPAYLGLAAIALAVGPGAARANDPGDGGEVEKRPWLGISYTSSGGVVGLLVTNVFEESPAIAAGLRAGDEIIEVDGMSTTDFVDLSELIRPRQIGDVITLRIWRGNQVLTLRPELTRRLTEAELIHVQLAGRLAPAFNLIRPEDPEGAVLDDSILRDRVGILVWFHTSCASCSTLANKIAPWIDAHRDTVGVVGLGTRPDSTIEQGIVVMQAIVKQSPILLPVGLDNEAWSRYGLFDQSHTEKAVVAVVDRNGVIQMATPIRGDADDTALDDVFAAAERALKPRKSRRAK